MLNCCCHPPRRSQRHAAHLNSSYRQYLCESWCRLRRSKQLLSRDRGCGQIDTHLFLSLQTVSSSHVKASSLSRIRVTPSATTTARIHLDFIQEGGHHDEDEENSDMEEDVGPVGTQSTVDEKSVTEVCLPSQQPEVASKV